MAHVLSSEKGAPSAFQAPSFCKQCFRDVDGPVFKTDLGWLLEPQ